MLEVHGLVNGRLVLETKIGDMTVRDLVKNVTERLNNENTVCPQHQPVSRFQIRLHDDDGTESTVQIPRDLHQNWKDVLQNMLEERNGMATLRCRTIPYYASEDASNDDEFRDKFRASCRAGRLEEVEKLLHEPVDPSREFKHGFNSQFHYACSHDDRKMARLLLEAHTDVNSVITEESSFDGTALNKACRSLMPKLVQLLLEFRGDVNRPNGVRNPPLNVALRLRLPYITYLSHELPVMVVDKDNFRQARTICTLVEYEYTEEDDTRVFELDTSVFNKCQAVAVASIDTRLEIARLLLSSRADVDSVGQNGETALIAAMEHGQETLTDFLLENGADLNFEVSPFEQTPGKTALLAAMEHTHWQIVLRLLNARADTGKVKNYPTALIAALSQKEETDSRKSRRMSYDLEVVRSLLNSNNDMNAVTAALEAVQDNIRKDFRPWKLDDDVIREHRDLLRLLLEFRADLSSVRDVRVPLHAALERPSKMARVAQPSTITATSLSLSIESEEAEIWERVLASLPDVS
ncbi:unnamed protein product [Symbiodinium sp. CCMP2592]|nr:unnamed protein product [Symbiodinium sp. CCMP2592]